MQRELTDSVSRTSSNNQNQQIYQSTMQRDLVQPTPTQKNNTAVFQAPPAQLQQV